MDARDRRGHDEYVSVYAQNNSSRPLSEARDWSANRLPLDPDVPSGRITDILNGRRAITADTALRLGRYFGNGAQFWLYL